MKKTIITTIITTIVTVAIIGFVVWYFSPNDNVGGGSPFDDRTVITLMGSATDLVSVPNEASYSNSTTTDSGGGVADGGYEIQQLVNTGGIRKVNLNLSMVGGTATSTIYLQVMGSPDGTNYYQRSTTTNPYTKIATTTVSIMQMAYDVVPGIATTTISIPIEIDGYRFTRFISWGDNLSTDPNDGVQAWITATLVRDKDR